jgi:hypothetical protein
MFTKNYFVQAAEKFVLDDKFFEIREKIKLFIDETNKRISEVTNKTSPEYRQELENLYWKQALERSRKYIFRCNVKNC